MQIFKITPRLCLLLSVLALSGCVTTGNKPLFERAGDSSKVISTLEAKKYEPSTFAVGQQRDVMNQRANTLGLVSVPELNKFLNGIRGKLLANTGVKEVPGQVYVTADPEMNAMATPDGNIFINWGLLRYLRSEDEVAGVIAHELAHVLLRHHDSNKLAHYQRTAQWYHGAGVMAAAALRNIQSNSQQSLKKDEVTQMQYIQLLVNLTTQVIAPTWQRTQEREADLFGVDLMVKAKYNPDGMLDLMSVIKQDHDNNKRGVDLMKLLKIAANATLGDKAQKLGSATELLAMAFGNDHPDPEPRMEDVANYMARHYDDNDTTRPFQRAGWQNVLKSGALRRTIAAYDGALSAQLLLDQNKPNEAYDLSKKTVSGARTESYPMYVHAITLYSVGKFKEGDAALQFALNNAVEPSGQVFGLYARVLENNGRYRDALALSNRAYDRFNKAPQFVPLQIRYMRLSGDEKSAREIANVCSRDMTDYRDACLGELNPPAPAKKS